MLRHQCCSREPTKLKLRLDTEQCSASAYQRRAGGHAHITGLYRLDNIVLGAVILQLDVLAVKVKCRIGIVIHAKFQPVAHRCIHRGLNLLVEVEIGLASRSKRQGGIIGLGAFYSGRYQHGTACAKLDAAGAEYASLNCDG